MTRPFLLVITITLFVISTSAFAGPPRWRSSKHCCARPIRTAACSPCNMAPTATAYCTGTCNDGVSVGAYGYGDNLGQAQSDANGKIVVQCASRGGVRSYDTCTPAYSRSAAGARNCISNSTAVRSFAVTESGNPAPGTGWYVELLVLSTGRTWYYGPYTYNDALFAFDQLNDNPSNQWAALPQYISSGTILQPW
jgi:hypothetical protein